MRRFGFFLLVSVRGLDSFTTTTTTATTSYSSVSTVTATSIQTQTLVVPVAKSSISPPVPTSTAVPPGTPIPVTFDTSIGVNFTSTACPSFFATFLADPLFTTCAPFSLLLSTSAAFFTAEQSPYSLLPFVLNATCAAPVDPCQALMNKLAAQIQLPSTCGNDLALGYSVPASALIGFRNYAMMRQAGCAKNPITDAYCFSEAAAESSPSDLYFYYLASGTSLPSGTQPNCNNCTENLMLLYSRYATNSSLVISQTYPAARQIAALECGPGFSPVVQVQKISSATGSVIRQLGARTSLGIIFLLLIFAFI